MALPFDALDDVQPGLWPPSSLRGDDAHPGAADLDVAVNDLLRPHPIRAAFPSFTIFPFRFLLVISFSFMFVTRVVGCGVLWWVWPRCGGR